MTDKDRLLIFINHLVPDNFVCGDFSLTFNDDGSAFISIANKDDVSGAEEDPPERSEERSGRWIEKYIATGNPGEYRAEYRCSVCGESNAKTAYCPDCGARMEDDGK